MILHDSLWSIQYACSHSNSLVKSPPGGTKGHLAPLLRLEFSLVNEHYRIKYITTEFESDTLQWVYVFYFVIIIFIFFDISVPAGHSFPDATGVAFALGLGPPSLLAAIFSLCYKLTLHWLNMYILNVD